MRSIGSGSLSGEDDANDGQSRSAQVRQVKETVRAVLGLPVDATVVVQELACAEPDCPPVETVIAVLGMGAANRQWTLHGPLGTVTEDQVRTLLARSPESPSDSA